MINFQLFRLRLFIKPTLFNQDLDRMKILKKLILAKPSAELRQSFMWHIGNVKLLDSDSAYFAIGRTTKSIVELYDIKARDFILGEYPEAPYTHAYIDFNLQVLAIAYKKRLAQYTKTIGKQLEKLLNAQKILQDVDTTADIAPLNDPRDFLTHIKEASIVKKFTAEITLPNPFDSSEDWEKPFQHFVRSVEGNKGKAIVSGDDLNRNVIEEVTRACAASGNDVSALMKDTEIGRFRTRHLKGLAVTLDYDDEDPEETRESFIKEIREIYNKIKKYQEEL
jgi:hypothetical protein